MSFSLFRIICHSCLFCLSQMIRRNKKLFFNFCSSFTDFPRLVFFFFILVTYIWTQHLLHKSCHVILNYPMNTRKKIVFTSLLIFICCQIYYHKDEKMSLFYHQFPFSQVFCLTLENKCPLSIEQEDITIVNNIYTKQQNPKLHKAEIDRIKGIDKSTIIAGAFNVLSQQSITGTQKINQINET